MKAIIKIVFEDTVRLDDCLVAPVVAEEGTSLETDQAKIVELFTDLATASVLELIESTAEKLTANKTDMIAKYNEAKAKKLADEKKAAEEKAKADKAAKDKKAAEEKAKADKEKK